MKFLERGFRMFSAVIAALLILVILAVVASLIPGILHERKRMRTRREKQSSAVTNALSIITSQQQPSAPETVAPLPSWYGYRRALLSISLLAMLLLAFILNSGLAGGALTSLSTNLGLNASFLSSSGGDMQLVAHPIPSTASSRLVRVDSTSRREYATDYEYNVWAYSSCSGMAMEMVMNAYGRHLIATDVLQMESDLGVWSTQLGLLRDDGIALTADQFGFTTSASHTSTLEDIIAISNKGAPVIVSVRDSRYYPGGHLFVIRGGDDTYVYTADSSIQNFTRMTHSMFLAMWQGFSAVLTPR